MKVKEFKNYRHLLAKQKELIQKIERIGIKRGKETECLKGTIKVLEFYIKNILETEED